MGRINALSAFNKTGLLQCKGTQIAELSPSKRLVYCFYEEGALDKDPIIIDFKGNKVNKDEYKTFYILFAGPGFE